MLDGREHRPHAVGGTQGLCHLPVSGRVDAVGDDDRRRLLDVGGERVDERAEPTRRPDLHHLSVDDHHVGFDQRQQRHRGVVDAEAVDPHRAPGATGGVDRGDGAMRSVQEILRSDRHGRRLGGVVVGGGDRREQVDRHEQREVGRLRTWAEGAGGREPGGVDDALETHLPCGVHQGVGLCDRRTGRSGDLHRDGRGGTVGQTVDRGEPRVQEVGPGAHLIVGLESAAGVVGRHGRDRAEPCAGVTRYSGDRIQAPSLTTLAHHMLSVETKSDGGTNRLTQAASD
ncbi:MAG: hypothetical protein PGN29_11085 [Gordonia paraffinivorans]